MPTRLDYAGVDLVLNLSIHNADRRCQRCGDDAAYYIFTENVASEFACEADFDDAIAAAQS